MKVVIFTERVERKCSQINDKMVSDGREQNDEVLSYSEPAIRVRARSA